MLVLLSSRSLATEENLRDKLVGFLMGTRAVVDLAYGWICGFNCGICSKEARTIRNPSGMGALGEVQHDLY